MEEQWVLSGHEKYNQKKVFMIPVANRKESTLIPIIKNGLNQEK